MAPPDMTPARRDVDSPPVVYLVNPEDASRSLDLRAVLAPIWRWRWIEMAIILLSLLASLWYVSRAPYEHVFVIDCGHFNPKLVARHLEDVIVPTAARSAGRGWSPAADMVITEGYSAPTDRSPDDDAPSVALKNSGVLAAGLILPSDAKSAAVFLDNVRAGLRSYFQQLDVMADAEAAATLHDLQLRAASAQAALDSMLAPEEINALRQWIEQNTSRMKGVIASLEESAIKLQSAAVGKRLADGHQGNDRDAQSLLDTEQRLNEITRRKDILQQELMIYEVEAMAAVQQPMRKRDEPSREAVAAAAESSAAAQTLTSQIRQGLAFQPPTVHDSFSRGRPVRMAAYKVIGFLFVGFIAALLSAYGLEALRLARQGAART